MTRALALRLRVDRYLRAADRLGETELPTGKYALARYAVVLANEPALWAVGGAS